MPLSVQALLGYALIPIYKNGGGSHPKKHADRGSTVHTYLGYHTLPYSTHKKTASQTFISKNINQTILSAMRHTISTKFNFNISTKYYLLAFNFSLIFLFTPLTLSSQNTNPVIGVCTGKQFICARDTFTDLCVDIIVNQNYPNIDIIKEFEITWGDGSPKTIVPGSKNPPRQMHRYDVKDLFRSCNYDKTFDVKLITKHTDPAVFQTNSIFELTIINAPKPDFTILPNPACVGDEIRVRDGNCPNEGQTLSSWDFGDGMIKTGASAMFTYQTVGKQNIRHCVGNVCDTACRVTMVEVLDLPKAKAVVDSGAVAGTNNPYIVCLGGGGVVRLNGLMSDNETTYDWDILPPTGWKWIGTPSVASASGITRLQLLQKGDYTVTLTVSNPCGKKDEIKLTLRAIEAVALSLTPQPDECTPLQYTPKPYNKDATYTINGVPQSTFPITLPLSNDPYRIQATLMNECGTQRLPDTFWIRPAVPAAISTPAAVRCVGGDTIVLAATPNGGTWSGAPGMISTAGGQTRFIPSKAGVFDLKYTVNPNSTCESKDTVRMTVEEAYPLALQQPDDGCISVQYTPMPFDAQVQYAVNGTPQTTFPVLLEAGKGPFTVTATAKNACPEVVKRVTFDVLRPVDVSINAPSDTTVCSGTAALPLMASDTVGKWRPDPNLIVINGQVHFDPKTPGTFSPIFERGKGDCRRADTLHIRVEPGDGVKVGPDLYVCNTETSLNLPNAMPAGVWGGPALNGTAVDIAALRPDSAYRFRYTVASLPPACNSDDLLLYVGAPIDPQFTLSSDTTCIGKTATLTANNTQADRRRTDWGDGTTDESLTHIYTNAGTYTVKSLAQTFQPGTTQVWCESSAQRSIHVIAAPEKVAFSKDKKSGCAPFTVTFKNESKAENARFVWDFGNGETFVGINPPPITYQQGIEDTTYYIRMSLSTGCDSAVVLDSVRVLAKPSAGFGVTYAQPCSGAILQANNTGRGNPRNNEWFFDNRLTYTTFNPPPLRFYTDSLARTILIRLISSNQCGSDTVEKMVTVNPTNVRAFANTAVDSSRFCAQDTLVFTSFSTPGAGLRWRTSTGDVFSGQQIKLAYPDAGQYFVVLYAEGCGYDSVIVPFRVRPLPTLAVVPADVICPGMPANFQVLTNGTGSTLWFGDGDSTRLQKVQHVYDSAGVYPFRAQAVSANGCRATASGNLTVQPRPKSLPVAPDSICAGATALFISRSASSLRCLWEFGDGVLHDTCTVAHRYTQAGVYGARLIVVSPLGCRDTAVAPVYVRATPSAAFKATVLRPCSPALVGFVSDVRNATALRWNFGDGTKGDQPNPQHTYALGGTYSIQLIATNENICSDTFVGPVTVYQTPIFDFTLTENCTIAEGRNLKIGTAQGNTIRVSGANYTGPGTGEIHPNLLEGTYNIVISTPQGCRNDTSITVLEPNELFFYLRQDTFTIVLGDSVRFRSVFNHSNTRFKWALNTWLNNDTIPNPVSTPCRTIRYIAKAFSRPECPKFDTAYVTVLLPRDSFLYIPNAFSPNDDDINSVFRIRSTHPGIERIESFRVFDTWNEPMFEAFDFLPTDDGPGWDGNLKGQKAEAGLYHYEVVLRYKDQDLLPEKNRRILGIVQLIR